MVTLLRPMTEHVDDHAARIPHEEPAHSPWFIRERINDVVPSPDGLGMDRVDVCDLDTHLRLNWCAGVTGHEVTWAVRFTGDTRVTTHPMSMATSKPRRPT